MAALERPRRLLIMVQAGSPTDAVIEEFAPLLDEGDVIIDGGNAHFADTRRREQALRERGIHFVGSGVSGGEEGALHGPSIMPGGSVESYAVLGPMLEKISAHVDGEPCCTHIGTDGAGHFVKMVHNGIEYADMQLIAEAYYLLRDVAGYTPAAEYGWDIDLGDVAKIWRGGCIIRAAFLDRIRSAHTADPDLVSLLAEEHFAAEIGYAQVSWRNVVAIAAHRGIPVPAFSAALASYDTLRAEHLPAALIQGLRDFFGAHTYHRTDREGSFHTHWAESARDETRTDG